VVKEISPKKKHYSYRFFRLGDEKAIPATTLRGVVRSVFEAITNSCFSNLGGERLSYRLPSGEVQKLVPARIEKNRDGEWRLRLLPGQAPFEPELGQKNGLYAAPVRFYRALKPTGRRREAPPPPIGDPDLWQHGKDYCAVLLKVKFPPSWRALALCENSEEAQRLKSAFEKRHNTEVVVQRGWLCKTNQNSDNKHSERFFFPLLGRADMPETLPLEKVVRDKYEELIEDYQQRHASTVEKRNHPDKVEDGEIAFSRFVLDKEERTLQGGELVYVRLRGRAPDLKVAFIAPVSWPRVVYEHTIADLLPTHHRHCSSVEKLCPACRTFGWVHQKGNREAQVAYAGRLRFSHALLKQQGEAIEPQTLAILSSPKPTTTRFYLADPKGRPSTKPRDDLEVAYDGNNGRNRLRGRKMYRHFIPNPKFMTSQEKSDQNRTIQDLEGKGAVFTFTVEFENLAPIELGALLWSLTLNDKGYHRIGYGKPLGLGSVNVKTTSLDLYDYEERYQSLTGEEWLHKLSAQEQLGLISQFQKTLTLPYASADLIAYAEAHGEAGWQAVFEELPHIQDLFALLGKVAPSLPVHYPYSPDPRSNGQFEWFVGNNRAKGPKIELSLASQDEGLPLIRKDGSTL
jgi:CRISPR-associated protein (TIGR03986 family)